MGVVKKGNYGLGYNQLSVEEIGEKVEEALSIWSPELSAKMARYSLKFSDEKFRGKIARIVGMYLG